jgi:hypothetical protein
MPAHLLALAVVAFPACEPGSVCSAGNYPETTIRLELTVEPTHMVSIEQRDLGPDAYSVVATSLLTGPGCTTDEQRLLVFDDRLIQDGPMITFQAVGGLLTHETPLLVTAVAWPGDAQVAAYLAAE